MTTDTRQRDIDQAKAQRTTAIDVLNDAIDDHEQLLLKLAEWKAETEGHLKRLYDAQAILVDTAPAEPATTIADGASEQSTDAEPAQGLPPEPAPAESPAGHSESPPADGPADEDPGEQPKADKPLDVSERRRVVKEVLHEAHPEGLRFSTVQRMVDELRPGESTKAQVKGALMKLAEADEAHTSGWARAAKWFYGPEGSIDHDDVRTSDEKGAGVGTGPLSLRDKPADPPPKPTKELPVNGITEYELDVLSVVEQLKLASSIEIRSKFLARLRPGMDAPTLEQLKATLGRLAERNYLRAVGRSTRDGGTNYQLGTNAAKALATRNVRQPRKGR